MGGGTNWPGAGFDPETNIFYTHAGNSSINVLSIAPPRPGFSDIRYVSGVAPRRPSSSQTTAAVAGERPRAAEGGGGTVGLTVSGLPLVKPPYGLLAAVDMNRGELLWQVPQGDTPDHVRNHPALKGLNIPKTGQGGPTSNVGLMITKTLVVLGDRFVTAPPGRPRGALLRAYDKKTGDEVGGVLLPAGQTGSPMTYMWEGRQYIIVAVGVGNYTGEYLAFRLPESGSRKPTQGVR